MVLLSRSTATLIDRVRGEFREMPGLTLTPEQAGRLWSLDQATCTAVLADLVDAGFLCRNADGAFSRPSDQSARIRLVQEG